VRATTQTGIATTNEAFVYLHGVFAADGIALGTNHASPQLMKDLKRGFIPGQAELPLELHRGLAGSLGSG